MPEPIASPSHASRPSALPLLIMPRKRIPSARITAKRASDDFSTATFAFWLSVSMPRGFTHRVAATIEEIRAPVDGSRGMTGNWEEQGVSRRAASLGGGVGSSRSLTTNLLQPFQATATQLSFRQYGGA